MKADKSHKKAVSEDVKKYVKDKISKNIETKMNTLTGYTTTASDSGWVLPYPTQGIDGVSRIGDKIKLTKFIMQGDLYNLGTTTTTVRIVVFLCKNSSLLTGATLFRVPSGAFVQGIVDKNFARVLHDGKYELDAYHLSANVSFEIPMKKVITFLQGTTTSVNDFIHVYVCGCNTSGVPTSGVHRLVADFQMNYQDA